MISYLYQTFIKVYCFVIIRRFHLSDHLSAMFRSDNLDSTVVTNSTGKNLPPIFEMLYF
jgi:hypothetical protein